MKKLVTLITFLSLLSISSFAQNPQFVKDGRTKVAAQAPFLMPAGRTQMMYTPASFAVRPPSGTITSIFFRNHYLDQYNATAFNSFSIKLIQTFDTVFSAGNFYSGGTQVLTSAYYAVLQTSVSNDGWLEFALPTSFAYDNTKSLIVDISYNGKTNIVNSWADSTAINNPKVLTSTSPTATTGTFSRQWNHFGMNVVPTSACTGPPAAGLTVAKHLGACGSNTYMLDLSGNSSGIGQSYQWQVGPSATGPFTNTGTASASSSYTVTPAANAWYRAGVTCGTFTTYSVPATIGTNSYLPAGTYTINSNQPTGGSNYRSFNSAVEAMSCGISGPVIFNVAPDCDTFHERVVVPVINNTSAANNIRINGNGGKLTYRHNYYVINNTYNYATIQLNGVNHLLIDSMQISRDSNNNYNSGYWNNSIMHIVNDANNITVQHCTFGNTDTSYYNSYNWNNNAIMVGYNYNTSSGSDCDSILIQNNTFIRGGIYVWGLTGTGQNKANKILRNRFLNENNYNYYSGGYGLIYLRGQDSAVVEGNYLQGRSNYSIWEGPDCSNSLISKNIIIDTLINNVNYSKYGMYIYGNNARVYNNVISLKGDYTLYGLYCNGTSTSTVISNNTIRLYGTATTTNVRNGIFVNALNTGALYIKNNIIVVEGTSSSVYSSGLRIQNTSQVVSDYNDIFTSSVNAVVSYVPSVGYNYYGTLSSWQSASGQDLNSYNVDPQFASAGTLDFHPTNLTIDDKGVPVPGLTDDIINTSRSLSAPDFGAYEFGNIPFCPPPTNVLASGISTTGATINWTAPIGSNTFNYVLDQSSANPAIVGTSITGTSYTANALVPYTTYYFHVRTNCGGIYSQWVTISFATGCLTPSATISPSGTLTVCSGSGTLLTAPANAGYSYQWKRNGSNVMGATTATLYATQSGNYTVEVTVGTCSATTPVPVTVNVLPGATISASGNTVICQGYSILLTSSASSSNTYQWQLNGANIPGATGISYTASAAGTYRSIVFNGMCADTTADLVVTDIPVPSATISPAGTTTFCDRQSRRLSVAQNVSYTYQWYRNGVAIPGAISYFYDATQSGNYTATLSNGSCTITSNIAFVTVYPLPTASITNTGSTTFCQGGSVLLTSNSGSGVTYQWQQNGVNIPGATNAFYSTATSGAYRVVVSNSLCADTSAVINVNAIPYPSSTITPPGPAAFCDQQSIRLNVALNATYNYQWFRNGSPIAGANGSFYDATLGGNYTATIGNNGCSVTTNPVSVTVHPLPVAIADAVGNTVFCNTGSVNIRATQGTGYTYQWMRNGVFIPGATGVNYVANQDGSFSVIVSNGLCSDTSAGVPVMFNAFPRPTIVLNGGVLSTTTAFTTYQWHRNGLPIAFANSRNYTPITDGNYVAVVGDTAGCLGSSNVITIKTLGVGTAGTSEVKIYPNPATDIVYIETGEPAVNASILAADGRTVLSQTCAGQLNIGALPVGIYSIKVMTLAGSLLKIEKLVKVR